jgi:hypothetical protein
MDPRDLIRNNGYIGPASFSVGMQYMNLAPTNWGVPAGPRFVVRLDPQLDAGKALFQSSSEGLDLERELELRSETVKRRIRRKLMSELTKEFSTSNDELLRELAR